MESAAQVTSKMSHHSCVYLRLLVKYARNHLCDEADSHSVIIVSIGRLINTANAEQSLDEDITCQYTIEIKTMRVNGS